MLEPSRQKLFAGYCITVIHTSRILPAHMPMQPAFPSAVRLWCPQALLEDFEFEYLDTLSDPVRTLETMLLVKLLSTHAQDELYLSGPQTDWISVRN